MKSGTKRDICAILLIVFVAVAFMIGGSAYIEAAMTDLEKSGVFAEMGAEQRADQREIPIYIVLKEPILVNIEVENCDHGVCHKEKDTGMIYKIRAGTTDITDHGMVNIIPYHKKARDLLGNHLRIPIVNIRCIVTGENKIQGHLWE
jgi:hypothetical protein